jgi:hypothetical protein
MLREDALRLLAACQHEGPETGHMAADRVLLAVIDDDEITAAFEAIPKWYA